MDDSPLVEPDSLAARSNGGGGFDAPASQTTAEAPIDIVPLPAEPLLAMVAEGWGRPLPGPGLLASLGWTAVLLVVQLVVVVFLAIPLMIFGMPANELEGPMFPIGTAAIVLLAISIALIHFRWRTARVLGLRRVRAVHVLLVLLTVAPMAIVASEVGAWAGEVLPSIENTSYQALATWPYAFVLLVGCVLPAIGEEIYFRGFIGRGLLARYGMVVGTLLSSVLFGAVHIDPPQAVGVMVMGLTLQGVFVATRSLLAPMLLHGLNNALSFTILKYDEPLADTPHASPLVVLTALLALITLGVMFYQMRGRWIMADGRAWSPGYVTGESPPPGVAAQFQVGRPKLAWLAAAVLAYAALVAAVVWDSYGG